MKLRILSIALVMISLFSCSSDDTSVNDTNNSDYFPLTTGNEWNYSNSSQTQGEQEITNDEKLTITSENDNAYAFNSSADPLERGIITGILANGSLSKQNGQLVYNGEYVVDLSLYNLDNLTIPLTDLVVYDINASAGENLSNISNTIDQTFNIQGQEIPLVIEYSLNTQQNEILESYSVSGTSYDNVLKSSVSLTLEVNANIIVSIPLLEEQEVLSSSNYYAENIGLIFSENQANYNFEDLSQFGVPNMDSIKIDSSQSIESYIIN